MTKTSSNEVHAQHGPTHRCSSHHFATEEVMVASVRILARYDSSECKAVLQYVSGERIDATIILYPRFQETCGRCVYIRLSSQMSDRLADGESRAASSASEGAECDPNGRDQPLPEGRANTTLMCSLW